MDFNNNKNHIALWQRLKKGDQIALGKIYDICIDSMFTFGMQYYHNKEHVMDSIHDVFLDVYKYRLKLADTDNIEYYLKTCLKRKLHKKHGLKTVTISDEYYLSTKKQVTSHETTLIANETAIENTKKLTKALGFLTKKQKKGIRLRFKENLPYEEIAEILNVSVQTSRTIIYRGIKVLRENIASIFVIICLFF